MHPHSVIPFFGFLLNPRTTCLLRIGTTISVSIWVRGSEIRTLFSFSETFLQITLFVFLFHEILILVKLLWHFTELIWNWYIKSIIHRLFRGEFMVGKKHKLFKHFIILSLQDKSSTSKLVLLLMKLFCDSNLWFSLVKKMLFFYILLADCCLILQNT